MRVAGVRLAAGKSIWVDAGGHSLGLQDRVTVQCGEERIDGWVFAHPPQFVRTPDRISGTVVSYTPFVAADAGCVELPGADMPPLGNMVEVEGREGMVVGLDVPHAIVTVRTADGVEISCSASDLVATMNA